MQSWWGEPEQVVKNCHHFHMLNSVELLTRGDNLRSNHGNQHLYITHNHVTMDILSWHVYQGIHYHYNHNQVSIGLHFP